MSQSPSKPSQARISQFFASSSQPGKRALSPIDLTADEGPPTKRAKRVSHAKPVSEATRQSIRKKLMQESHLQLLRRNRDEDYQTLDRHVEDEEEQENRDEDEHVTVVSDDDGGFKDLISGFASKKGKNKSRAEAAAKVRKKAETIGPSGKPYTPLEKQVLRLKEENPDTVIMFEVGYRYRFFGEDAKIAQTDLGMYCYQDRNYLVASIPVHRREVHLKKLLSQGHRVGIAAQVETAALKKVSENRNAPFDRQLVALYTAATYVDDLSSVDSINPYIAPSFCCLVEQPDSKHTDQVCFALVSICPSTGDVTWDEFKDGAMRLELDTRLSHIRPAEILIHSLTGETQKFLSDFRSTNTTEKVRSESLPDILSYTAAFDYLSKFYSNRRPINGETSGTFISAITAFPSLVTIALAHATQHLDQYNLADALVETTFFRRFTESVHMQLGANTLLNLEIYQNQTDFGPKGTLLSVLDRTQTKFGARLLKTWVGRPLIDRKALTERLDAIDEIMKSTDTKLVTLRGLLADRKIPDLAKGLSRVQSGQCTPKEFSSLLVAFNKLSTSFLPFDVPTDVGFESPILNDIFFRLSAMKPDVQRIYKEFSIQDGAEDKMHSLWLDSEKFPAITDNLLSLSALQLEFSTELKSLRKFLRIPSLDWTSINGEDYLVQISKAIKVPDDWLLVSRTRSHSRYRPPSVRDKLDELKRRTEMLDAETRKAYKSYLKEVSEKHYAAFRNAVSELSIADCLNSLAKVSLQEGYVRPEITDDEVLDIVDGRHPIAEVIHSEPYVPNTIRMGGDFARNKIITGPNMGGKSSAVRMVALLAIMAQIGCYIPAASARIGLLDNIYTRMGASDDLARGRSTFMVELSETTTALQASPRSLVILDELGRGTSTFDGMAIASAVMEYLVASKCRTLFITHYPLVASQLERQFPTDIENIHMSYQTQARPDGTKDITFMYTLTPGIARESFGITCGRLAGLPDSILGVAHKRGEEMQEKTETRIRKNAVGRIGRLLRICLASDSDRPEESQLEGTLQELKDARQALSGSI